MKFLITLSILTLLTGCTHALHIYNISDSEYLMKKYKSKRAIKSSASQDTVMGVVDDTKYLDLAFSRLKKQCKNGNVTQINSRYSTSHGFFSWTNKIHMQAYCIK